MTEKTGGSGAERRRAKRVYASFVEYCHIEDHEQKRIQAFTENISSTGICIFTNENIPADCVLSIIIYLLDGTGSISSKGRVVWVRPSEFLDTADKKHFDVGIEFVEIDEEDRKRLSRYAAEYDQNYPPVRM